MQLIWRETALIDLDRIVVYVSQFNYVAATRLQALAESCAERIVEHPFLYRAGRIPGTREGPGAGQFSLPSMSNRSRRTGFP